MTVKSVEQFATPKEGPDINRRNILLSGSALVAAATGLGASAQAQQPAPAPQAAAPSGRRPNILVIWGDDIGTWNKQPRHDGLHDPQHRPDRA